MALMPSVYGGMLEERINKHNADCWLVNTGWIGGPYGVGERISIKYTRTLLNAALDGKLDNVEMRVDPTFGFEVPVACEGVPAEILNPRESWENKDAYDAKANELAQAFISNFESFDGVEDKSISEAGPKN
jgi:phosphoenolpyruvate carboxykinase (ATP)